MSQHTYRNDHRQVTVAELIARMTAEGLPVRLAWSEAEMNGQVPRDMGDWPTGVLPTSIGASDDS
jgi:hypothetical protein